MKKSFSMLALASVLLAAFPAGAQRTASAVPHFPVFVDAGNLRNGCTATLGAVAQGKPVVMNAAAKDTFMGVQADKGSEVLLTVTCEDGASGIYKTNANDQIRFAFERGNVSPDEWLGFVGPVPALKIR